MTRALFRLALRGSWAGRRVAVQRALVASLAAGAATVVVCGVVSTTLLLQRVEERSAARSFAPVVGAEPAAIRMHVVFDAAPDGDQIYVYWWRLLDPDVHLPGVPERPAVDSWYVSPALADRIETDPALAGRFPGAEEIARSGIANADELVAYRFVDPTVDLSDSLSARLDPDAYLADPVDTRVRSVLRAAFVLLALPVLGLLFAGLAPLSASLDQRLGVLEALGASRRVRSSLIACQAALSATPGALAGAAGWWAVAPHLTTVPFVGRRVFAGDLRISVSLALASTVLVLVAAGTVAAARHRGAASGRPSRRVSRPPDGRRALLLVLGLTMMAAGSGLVADSGRLYLTGLFLSAVGGVAALPLLFVRLGDALADSTGTLPLLVGRRLRWNARTASRSLLLVGVLAALSPVAFAWIQLERARLNDAGSPTGIQPVPLEGALPTGEVESLRRRTGAVPVELVADRNVDPAAQPPPVLVGDCRALGRLVDLTRCDESGFALSPAAEPGFARYSPDGAASSSLVGLAARPEGYETVATLFVGEDRRAVEAALRAHIVNRAQPGPPVGYVEYLLHESPLTRWALGGLVVGTLTAGMALGLHLAAQAARSATSRTRLGAMGMSRAALRRLAATESALTVALTGLSCCVVGALANWWFVQLSPGAAMNLAAIGIVVAAVLAAAALSGVASWFTTSETTVEIAD
jgi:hypothetical protein